MKIAIDKHGHLHLEKRGKMVAQYCPNNADQNGDPAPCGEWCPLFSIDRDQDEDGLSYRIGLCHHKMYCAYLKDITLEASNV